MFNIDNCYFVLRNLFERELKSKFVSGYFDPSFITKEDNLLLYDYEHKHNVDYRILFLDQEPLKQTNYIDIPDIFTYPDKRTLLANSEKNSIFKKQFLQHYPEMIDFYYFWHGFASLDWYRNFRFVRLDKNPKFDYLINCKGITGTRSYRLYLLAKLFANETLQDNIYSFQISEEDQHFIDIVKKEKFFTPSIKNFITDNIRCNTSVVYDDLSQASASANINCDVYSSVRFQIVTETTFYDNRLHLTEKTFQPIVTRTPFIHASGSGNLEYLKEYGFKDYQEWLPCDNNNKNWQQRIDSISDTVKYFSRQSDKQKDKTVRAMSKIAEYNHSHFYNNFFDIIYKEMIENLHTAKQTADKQLGSIKAP